MANLCPPPPVRPRRPVQVRDVDDQAGTGRVGGVAVAARARRHLHVGVPGEGEAALDIAGRFALGDRRRLLRVDGVVEVTGCGVSAVGGEEQGAGERCGKLRPVGSAVLCRGCGGTAAACVMVRLELEHPAAAAPAITPDPSTVAPRRKVRRSIRSERFPPPRQLTRGHGGRG